MASILPSIPLHTVFLFAFICGKRRLRLGAPLFCCLAVCGFFSVCNCAVVTKSLQLLSCQLNLTIVTMLRPQLLRQAMRALSSKTPRSSFRATQPAVSTVRNFSRTPYRFDKEPSRGGIDAATTAGEPGESGDHEGQYARTDKSVRVEYPEEEDLPSSRPVQGRGGFHFKRTLASFSLEDRVGVITGGARGLGLVMSQALVASGADVAIVDLNSPLPCLHLFDIVLTRHVTQRKRLKGPP